MHSSSRTIQLPGPGVGRSQFILVGGLAARLTLFVIITSFLGRGLSAADFGFIALVFGIFLVAHELIDFGTTALVTRRVASQPQIEFETLNTLFAWRRLLCIALALLMLAGSFALALGFDQQCVLVIAAFALLAMPLTSYHVIFQTRQAYGQATLLGLGSHLAFLLASAAVLHLTPEHVPSGWSSGAMVGLLVVVRELVQLAGSRALARRMLGRTLSAAWRDPGIGQLLRSTINYGLAGVGYKLSALSGSFFVWILAGPQALGSYGAAQRLFTPQTEAAWLFATPLIAAMSLDAVQQNKVMHAKLTALTQLMLALSSGVAVCGLFLAPTILQWLYGVRYADGATSSVATFQWLSLAMTFALVTPVLAVACLVHRRETQLMQISFAGLAATVLGNLLLVSQHGAQGAAMAWCAGEAVVMLTLLTLALVQGDLKTGWDWLVYLVPGALLAIVLSLLSPWPLAQFIGGALVLGAGLLLLRRLPPQQAARTAYAPAVSGNTP
ncbi:MAG: hypothetical protein EOO54_19415 [Haliea sp.]|nr:MAG: hypothetical protein EOO54_19415 [Haliea sp.]